MQLMLQSIPLTETLRYALGAKAPDPLPDALAASTKEACQALLPVCQPRYTYLVRPTQPLLEGLLSGDDIRRHLQGCEQCVLFGATLGPQADALIRRAQVDDMAKALWLDAAASAAIEEVCDEAQRQIALELECALTARFSCGYGDLPLAIQPQFLSLLDAGAKSAFRPAPLACSPRSSRSPPSSASCRREQMRPRLARPARSARYPKPVL